MNSEKLQLVSFSSICVKNRLSAIAATKEINAVEIPGAVNERKAQNSFRRFKESDKSLEDKRKWSRRPYVVEDDALLKMVEKQQNTSARTWSRKPCSSKILINQHFH